MVSVVVAALHIKSFKSFWLCRCEYIFYRGLYRTAYARVSRSTITDTELQIGQFLLPKHGVGVTDESTEVQYLRAWKEEMPQEHVCQFDSARFRISCDVCCVSGSHQSITRMVAVSVDTFTMYLTRCVIITPTSSLLFRCSYRYLQPLYYKIPESAVL